MKTTTPKQVLFRDRIETPVGTLELLCNVAGALCALGFDRDHIRMQNELQRKSLSTTIEAKVDPHGLSSALKAYFNGELDAIEGLRVQFEGTEFQQRVWNALLEIPCGETRSYSDIAVRIGQPRAVRAVGLANGSNPIAIVVPCHRVIGQNGSLTGYGGGLERKRWLLAHERMGKSAERSR